MKQTTVPITQEQDRFAKLELNVPAADLRRKLNKEQAKLAQMQVQQEKKEREYQAALRPFAAEWQSFKQRVENVHKKFGVETKYDLDDPSPKDLKDAHIDSQEELIKNLGYGVRLRELAAITPKTEQEAIDWYNYVGYPVVLKRHGPNCNQVRAFLTSGRGIYIPELKGYKAIAIKTYGDKEVDYFAFQDKVGVVSHIEMTPGSCPIKAPSIPIRGHGDQPLKEWATSRTHNETLDAWLRQVSKARGK